MKIRVPVSDIFIRMLRLLGANATPLSLGEVYSGMETHMIDGAENNIRSFHSSRHFEAARYWSQSEHSYAPDVLLLSRRTWEALAPADRELLRETARASVQVMRQAWDASEASAREQVLAAGIETNAVDSGSFRRAAAPLLAEYRSDPRIDALYARIRAIA
jgi:TRAP-type C4-dicarboxylate transport system substrate-binding protein